MSRGWGSYDYGSLPRSRPRAAKGGIKAQSKRGTFGESWWAKRWIEVLESFNLGARLGRGRSYARSGQVLAITIEKGVVTAQVQGSRPSPYRVTIKLKVLPTTCLASDALQIAIVRFKTCGSAFAPARRRWSAQRLG